MPGLRPPTFGGGTGVGRFGNRLDGRRHGPSALPIGLVVADDPRRRARAPTIPAQLPKWPLRLRHPSRHRHRLSGSSSRHRHRCRYRRRFRRTRRGRSIGVASRPAVPTRPGPPMLAWRRSPRASGGGLAARVSRLARRIFRERGPGEEDDGQCRAPGDRQHPVHGSATPYGTIQRRPTGRAPAPRAILGLEPYFKSISVMRKSLARRSRWGFGRRRHDNPATSIDPHAISAIPKVWLTPFARPIPDRPRKRLEATGSRRTFE